MITLKSLINELRVTDISKNKTAKLFIAWKDKLFIFDEGSDISEIIHWLEYHPSFNVKYGFEVETADELINYAADMPPDVVAGQYNPTDKTLYVIGSDKSNPVTSVILSKVIRQLRIKSITKLGFDEEDIKYSTKKNIGDIPSVGFHGTNTLNLDGILKNGIEAGVGPGNFKHTNVVHTIDSFFSVTFDDAVYYAHNSTVDNVKKLSSFSGKGVHKSGAYPTIIEFNVPDKSKIIPDYDADAHSLLKRFYSHEKSPKEFGASPMKPMGLSKESGKFGYRGRILPGHFRFIHFYSDIDKRWRKFKPSTVTRGLMIWGSYWYNNIGIRRKEY